MVHGNSASVVTGSILTKVGDVHNVSEETPSAPLVGREAVALCDADDVACTPKNPSYTQPIDRRTQIELITSHQ